MGFVLAGGNFGDDLAGLRIDGIEGLRELGSDVEQTIGTKVRIVRTEGFSEIDGVGEFARGDVDDVDGAAIAAGLADASTLRRSLNTTAVTPNSTIPANAIQRFIDIAAGPRDFTCTGTKPAAGPLPAQ